MKTLGNNSLYRFGDFVFDAEEGVLTREGAAVSLTPKMFEVLKVLIGRRGRIVSKDDLMKAVWPDSFVEEGNLAVTIRQLRKALDDDARRPAFIETIPRRGYKFVADVQFVVEPSTFEIEKQPSTAQFSRPAGLVSSKSSGVVVALADWRHSEAQSDKTESAPSFEPVVAKNAAANKSSWLIPLIALIAALGGGYGLYRAFTLGEVNDSAFNQMRLKTDGKVTNAAAAPNGGSVVFAQKEETGESLWIQEIESGNRTQLLPADDVNFVGLAVSPDGGFAYYSVFSENSSILTLSRVSLNGGGPERLDDIATDTSVSFSPDGKKIAFTDTLSSVRETYLKIASSDGSDQKTLITAKGEDRVIPFYRASPVAWSPDGKVIACSIRETDETESFYRIMLVDPENGSEEYLSERRFNLVENITWRDAETLAFIERASDSPNRQVWQISRKTGAVSRLTDDLNDYEWLSSSNGKLFTVQKSLFSSLHVAESSGSEAVPQTKQILSEFGAIENLLWAANGKIVYNSWVGGGNDLWNVNPDGTDARQLTRGSNLTSSFAISPVDGSIVFSARQNGKIALALADASGGGIRPLTEGPSDLSPSFSPDGKTVVFQRGVIKPTIWRVDAKENSAIEQLTGYAALNPAVSPNGEVIAYQFMDYGGEKSAWKLGLVSSGDRRLLRKLEFPIAVTERKTFWHPDMKILTAIFNNGRRVGLLLISISDEGSRIVENIAGGRITSFAWSPDGDRFAFSQTLETNDVVSVSKF